MFRVGRIGVERFLVLKFGVEDDITGIVDAAAVQPDFEFGQPRNATDQFLKAALDEPGDLLPSPAGYLLALST